MTLHKICVNIAKQQNRKKQMRDYYVIYTLLFAAVSFVTFFTFIVNGKSFVWQEDGLAQHYNALLYFGIWVRDIFRNVLSQHTLEIPLWDFNIGYGSDIITTLNYYAIGDPLDLLAIFVPSKYTEYLYGALVILRLYLAGITFSMFCFRMNKGRMAVMSGSFAYAFCGYALYAGIRHPFFINPMIYLPLLLIGVENIIRRKKPALFIVMVFVSAVSNFYFFYMLVIAIVFYVVARFFTLEHENRWRELLGCILKFLFYGIIGVLLSAFILLPVILLFLNGLRTDSSVLHPVLYNLKYYQSFITGYFSINDSNSSWRVLGLAAPTLLGIFTLFSQRKKRTVMKASFVIMVVMLCIPEIGSIMNGLSYVCNRWCFFFAALVCYILVEVWPDMMSLKSKQKGFLILCTAIYYVFAIVFDVGVSEATFLGMTILLLALALLLAKSEILSRYRISHMASCCMVGLTIFHVCVIAHYCYDYKENNYVSEFIDRGELISTIKESSTAAIWEVNDGNDAFGRTDLSEKGVNNSSTITKVPTTQFYWSLAKGTTSRYLLDMSMSKWSSYNYKNVGSRTFLEALASVRYYVKPASITSEANYNLVPYGFEEIKTVITNSKEKERFVESYKNELGVEELSDEELGVLDDLVGTYTVFKNNYALPLGYSYSGYITRGSYDRMSSGQRQEALLQGVLLEDDVQVTSDEISPIDPVFTQQALKYELECGNDVLQLEDGTFLAGKSGASIVLTFEGAENCELYLMASGLEAEAKTALELYQDGEGALFSKTIYNEMSRLDKNKLWRTALYDSNWSNTLFSISVKSGAVTGSMEYANPYYTWGIGQKDFLVNLGYQDEARTKITIKFPIAGEYHFDNLEVICQPMEHYAAQISSLKEEVLENEEIGTNSVKGSIRLARDKILCLTIPYDKGWKAYVDGVETDLLRANVMYMALPLSAGEHTVELYYQTYGLKEGVILTAAGIILFVIVIISGQRRGKKVRR